MFLEHKKQQVKSSSKRKTLKTIPSSYSKLVNSKDFTSSFSTKCNSSANHYRFKQKVSAVLSTYLTPKKSIDYQKPQKTLKTATTAVKIFQPSPLFQHSRTFQSSGSRSTSSMLCKSRPSFVEPEPLTSPLISYQPVQSPKDEQLEVYKFPLLRDKQSKSFSLNLNKSHFFPLGSPVSALPFNPTYSNDAKSWVQKSFAVHFK